jgi:hypothetical protein
LRHAGRPQRWPSEVDAVGPAVGAEIADLSDRLRGYDLVFASARSALEAMAAACAVMVIDGRGLAGLVTRDNVAPWRENNFGLRVLSRQSSADAIVAELDRYDAKQARAVCDFIRAYASLDDHIGRLEQIHREVIAEWRATPIDNGSLPQLMGRRFARLPRPRNAAAHRAQTRRFCRASLFPPGHARTHRSN